MGKCLTRQQCPENEILRLRAAVKNSPKIAYVRQVDFPAVKAPARGMNTQNDTLHEVE